ncbi:hypothetical protein [Porphyromonas vaginalis]|uniref:hypothetical protein n=1 Tax=Porphyromonas vaginalis TaxID=3044325 RepID=UPI00262EC7DA|nr:hypothetical protein [Porphyromonas vaginalis]
MLPQKDFAHRNVKCNTTTNVGKNFVACLTTDTNRQQPTTNSQQLTANRQPPTASNL